MQDCKGVKIPMPTNGHLCTDENGIDFDQKVYRSMIGSLLYLCSSRPDIMLSVCMCARYQAAPKECHIKVVKRIVRYLIHTPNFGIWYPKRSPLILLATPIRTMPVTRLIESPLRVLVNSLVDFLCLGIPRNKTRYPYPPPKRNTLPLVHVVLNYFG